jgi:hypothetical protein
MTLNEAIAIVADWVRVVGDTAYGDTTDEQAIQIARADISPAWINEELVPSDLYEAFTIVLTATDTQIEQAFTNAEPLAEPVTWTGREHYPAAQIEVLRAELDNLTDLIGEPASAAADPQPVYQRPKLADVRRGGRFGQHVLPSRADDSFVQGLVKVVFAPQPMFPGGDCCDPCAPEVVQQLLDHAPQTDRTGVDDWGRGLRADEIAAIYGEPMEGDPLEVRINWLRRADELCRAWGRPLAGPGGLVPDMTLPDLPDPQ